MDSRGDDTPTVGRETRNGGLGEPPSTVVTGTDPERGMSRADMVMIQSVLRRQFAIPDAVYEAIPVVLARILADDDKPPRTRLSAIRAMQACMAHGIRQIEALAALEILNPSEEAVKLLRTPLRGPGEATDAGRDA